MESTTGPEATTRPIAARSAAVTVVGLVTLAVVQPVLDIVARGPEFLVVHRLDRFEILLMVGGLVAVALAAGLVTGFAISLTPDRARLPLLATLVGGALGLIALQVGVRSASLSDRAIIAVAVMVGGGGGLAYRASNSVRLMGNFLGVAPLVVASWFLLNLPGSLMGDGDTAAAALAGEVAPMPVVIVIFDELPVASLIDDGGNLLDGQYPSFSRLAADGVWYRNAVTVQTRTTESIPAILSGSLVPAGLLPNPIDHPQTILTLLADSHHVAALEPVTDLCPASVCQATTAASEKTRWRSLAKDLAVILGHLSVPSGLAQRLPSIDQSWAGFTGATLTESGDSPPEFDLMERVAASVERDRRRDVDHFLRLVEESPQPGLVVGHFMLPHRPWNHLPDGRLHGDEGMSGHDGRGWVTDPYLMATGWRRHLLQVGYADTIVGAIIERLADLGIYDSTLLVVVADHGVTFAPGVTDMRVTDANTLGSILAVPLFIKYPAGTPETPHPGTITDVRAQTIDIVPTILDVLGVAPPQSMDGASLLGPVPGGRLKTPITIRGEELVMSAEGREKLDVAGAKLEWFPGGDPWSLVPVPAARSILGLTRETVNWPAVDSYAVELEPPTGAVVSGTISGLPPPTGSELVALTIDRVIEAVTRVRDADGHEASFVFLVNPDLLEGDPEISAFVVESAAR